MAHSATSPQAGSSVGSVPAAGGGIGEGDVIDQDVPPSARVRIDDLEDALLAFEVRDVPALTGEFFGIGADGGPNGLVADTEVHAGFGGMPASGDGEAYVPPLDLERLGSQLSGGLVVDGFGSQRIGEVFPTVTRNPLGVLVPGDLAGRLAERLALDTPLVERTVLEGLEGDVRAFGALGAFGGGQGEVHPNARQTCGADNRVAAAARCAAAEAYSVLKPARNRRLDRLVRRVPDGEADDRGRVGRVAGVKWDPGREDLLGDLHGQCGLGVSLEPDFGDGVLADKLDGVEVGFAEEGGFGLVALALDAHREALLKRALGAVGLVSAAVPLISRVIEYPPLAQRSVSADVELAGAHAAARHADGEKLPSAVDLAFAPGEQGFDPRRRHLLVDRYNVSLLHRVGSGAQEFLRNTARCCRGPQCPRPSAGADRRAGRCDTRELHEFATIHCVAPSTGGLRQVLPLCFGV